MFKLSIRLARKIFFLGKTEKRITFAAQKGGPVVQWIERKFPKL